MYLITKLIYNRHTFNKVCPCPLVLCIDCNNCNAEYYVIQGYIKQIAECFFHYESVKQVIVSGVFDEGLKNASNW